MPTKRSDCERYFNTDIEQIYILNILYIWGGYLVGQQVD